MKTIYIVRHAKSSWDYPHLNDHERPLLEKGKKRTKVINDYFIKNKIAVDLIVSSHAVRAMETAKIIGHAIGYATENIRIDRMIYHADSDRIFDQFYDIPEDFQSIMIVGHNPTVTNFVNFFLDEKIDWLPTSGVVSVSFETDDWGKISVASHKTNFFITPKMLKVQ